MTDPDPLARGHVIELIEIADGWRWYVSLENKILAHGKEIVLEDAMGSAKRAFKRLM